MVRHADAGVRGRSRGPDHERVLSERGWRQANLIADRLADAGVKRLVSSPFVRCVQTLEPLAARVGLTVETDERLAEAAGFGGALELAEELKAKPAAVCSHGDVIPDLLEALVRRGMKLKDEARWQKASTWVLKRDKDGFTKASYVPPPA